MGKNRWDNLALLTARDEVKFVLCKAVYLLGLVGIA
jgi:hypothetical protein